LFLKGETMPFPDPRPALRKVVITNEGSAERLDGAIQRALPDAQVVVSSKDSLNEDLRGAQLTVGAPLTAEQLAIATDLVWHHVPWAGVESAISPELVERGIVLTNNSGMSAPNMAEHLVAMMLAFARAIPTFVRFQQQKTWARWDEDMHRFELTGQTVLLLGTGAIGRETARRLRGFGCTIIGARRRQGDVDGFDRVIGFDQVMEVLPEVDHVVSSLPMTPHTDRIVSQEMIAGMKPGTYFFNVGRGGTVDQDALIEALRNGHLAGAGLDVTTPEPLPQESPLWDMDNVLITCHTSGGSPKTRERVATVLVENLRRYESGEPLLNEVDLAYGY
jgi:phosphoglycerate dehydrogenase-like enzyme